MKLYYHPVSTTSRTVMLFAAETGLDIDFQVVDLLSGEHLKEPFASINPNRLVPVLEDGDFRLTESSAILKYLAEKIGSPAYPKDLKRRAKVNEMMDWLNTGFYRDFGYGLVYPQVFPHHQRPGDALQSGTLDWGKGNTKNRLGVLDRHLIGPDRKYLCGNEITIADYFGAPMLTLHEVIGCDLGSYPNIARWLGTMKSLKSWQKVNEVFDGWVTSVKGTQFVTI